MLKLPDLVEMGLVEAPDVLVGGTPCQSFSLAGRRGSLEDERGALTLAFVELANRIDERRIERGEQESIVVWENVPGVLNTKDNAFGAFLAGLAGEDVPLEPPGKQWTNAGVVSGPQRTVAWRVLDAQHFGVPQRRRRVFVVASARNDIGPAEILFEREGLCGDSPSPGDKADRKTGTDADAPIHGTWWNGSNVSQTLDAVLHKKQCLPEKNRFPAVMVPAWFECEACGDYLCAYHGVHAHECDCPAIDDWCEAELFPYAPSLLRYITPVEAERLQGFPDNHTLVPWKSREAEKCPDGPRYKAAGNSMAVPVMAFLGSRLNQRLYHNV
jgi:DNA (cytosine-5)-methyltransferase 1